MKLLFIKNINLLDGVREFSFKRMSIYQIPDVWALDLISQGYAVKLIERNELSTIEYFPNALKNNPKVVLR